MNESRPVVSTLLKTYFAGERAAGGPTRRRRVEQVERMLRTCLETDGDRVLGPRQLSLLAAERVFDPVGAYVRTAHVEDLVNALPLFLTERWRPDDPADARLQVRLAEGLAEFLVARRFVDRAAVVPALLDLGVAAARVRAGIADDRRPTRRQSAEGLS